MPMRRLTGWLAKMLEALPWRRSRRQSRHKLRARTSPPRQAVFSDPNAARWPNPESTRRYPTWPQEPASPRRKTSHPTPEPPPAPTAIVPASPSSAPSPPVAPGEPAAPEKAQLEAQRRLAFARYLVRRGTFNEGFAPEALPPQYQPPGEAL